MRNSSLTGYHFRGGKVRRCSRVLSHKRIPTPFERRTTTIRISLKVIKLGTSSWSASKSAVLASTPLTSTGKSDSSFNITLLPSNSNVPSRVGARLGRRMSLSGSEPMTLFPLRRQNKPANASQPFSRRRLLSTSCRHRRIPSSYSLFVMMRLYLNGQLENLQFCYKFSRRESTSINLSCFHTEGKIILLRCKDTSGVFRERARRTISIIEIQNDLAIYDRLSVIVSAGGIRLFTAGQISKLDEQLLVFYFSRIQLISLALELKGDISIHAVFNRLAQCIGLVRYLRFRIASITCIDTETFVDWEPLQQRKRKTVQ